MVCQDEGKWEWREENILFKVLDHEKLISYPKIFIL